MMNIIMYYKLVLIKNNLKFLKDAGRLWKKKKEKLKDYQNPHNFLRKVFYYTFLLIFTFTSNYL